MTRNEWDNYLLNVQDMDNVSLIAELNDVVQLEIAKMSADEWIKFNKQSKYLAIVRVLSDRLNGIL